MKFLKFPSLIQLEILILLNPVQYFLLSLCSRKTGKCVKRLEYKNAEIWIEEDGNFFAFSLRTHKSCAFLFYANVQSLENFGNWTTKIEYDGQQAEFLWKTIKKDQASMELATQKCVRIVFKYICDLFNAPLNDIYFHELRGIPFYFGSTFGKNIKRSIFKFSRRLTWIDLEEFYTQFPDQEYSEIRDEVKMDQLNLSLYYSITWKNQKIMDIQNLVIWHTDDQSSQFLHHFKGEHGLFMSCDYLTSYHFNKFLKNWINGENENLKSRSFFSKNEFYVSNEEEIFEGIKIHEILDSEQRKFNYGPLIEKYDQYLPRPDFLNGTKIERTSDGKLANVFFNEQFFAIFLS
ncbi:unnamed protein product [Caenorhabditis nigoni]